MLAVNSLVLIRLAADDTSLQLLGVSGKFIKLVSDVLHGCPPSKVAEGFEGILLTTFS